MAARTGWIWALAILAVVCASTVAQQQTVEGRIAFPEGTVASDWRVAVAADAAPILTDALAAEAAAPREDGAFAVDLPDGRPWYLLTTRWRCGGAARLPEQLAARGSGR